MNAHIRGIPEQLRCFCGLCPHETSSLQAIADHLETAHGHSVQRWPDGGVVVDMSDIPELMAGGEQGPWLTCA